MRFFDFRAQNETGSSNVGASVAQFYMLVLQSLVI
jgi:hypothetical protein